ncbi:hypothetical protein GCM10027451_29400 [Geodermatophilus aquaeductus]|uniref:Uncharacterized protein n=1 Tax=Geodermatophilus aquaeductus TaxID=1564161 RepID=A0A521F557_9ACTN|nr:hypothetical protein [Geodermatophilus aquaeductus]SMO91206.1 hypothetical protein SAMN06273567_10725 [Geodermatophilus aquaeductus]
MATSLQHLLDELTTRTHAPAPTAAIEDVTGALAHLGRALTGLTEDGLSPAASARQQTAAGLAGACATAGGLWPRTGGPLTDLAGAAADLVGRHRGTMGRAHRWAVTVELAEVAEHCARLGRRLLPPEAAPELVFVRQSAADVERDAQASPPTADGCAVLDRLVPLPGAPPGGREVTALDAAAALAAALDRARRADDLTLRDFRAAVAATEITSRSAAMVAGTAGEDAGPLVVTGLAWQLAGRASMVFHDGRVGEPIDPRGVVAHARALADALRLHVGDPAGIAHPDDGRDLSSAAGTLMRVVGQLPALADRLVAAVDRWSRTGRLYADARDLPPMEDMPGDRVQAVIGGRTVQASGADLDHLRRVVARAAALTTGLASARTPAEDAASVLSRPSSGRSVRSGRIPGSPQRLLDRAQAEAGTVSATRPSPGAPSDGIRGGPARGV